MKYIAALILCVFISSCSEQTPPSVAIQDNEAIYVLILTV
jgi:hypothetical protein